MTSSPTLVGFFVCEMMGRIIFLNNCKEIQIRLSAQDKIIVNCTGNNSNTL